MSRNPDKDNIVSDNADWKLAYKQNYNWWCCMLW